MGVPARLHHYSFQDYLMVEERNPVRHEFLDGDIYAMAGGSMLHAALAGAVLGSLDAQLAGRCLVSTFGRIVGRSRSVREPAGCGSPRPSEREAWRPLKLSPVRSTSMRSTPAPAVDSRTGRDRSPRQRDVAAVDEAPLNG